MEKPKLDEGNIKETLFAACLATLERTGWKKFSFSVAAQEADIPLDLFYEHFSSPVEILRYLFQKIDCAVLKMAHSFEEDNPRDRLFELLMARFEAAEPYKSILQSFWQDCILTPEEVFPLMSQGFASMTWVLDAARLNNRGLKGLLRIQGLSTLYLLTLRTWLADESPDLGKTMAYLDKGLSRLESLAHMLQGFEE